VNKVYEQEQKELHSIFHSPNHPYFIIDIHLL
jgi:hypothetical protein